jgi:hypothetical protein
MAKKKQPELPIGPLADLLAWWQGFGVQGMIIGGLAVALLGRPRATKDVDAVILLEENRWADFLKAGADFSFETRIPNAQEFARQNRVLLLVHQNSGIEVDISLGGIPFEIQAIARAKATKVGKLILPLATPEDLIVMKAIAHRSNDLFDIEGLFAVHANLDIEHIRRWVDKLAQELEFPELYESLDRMIIQLKKQPKLKRKKPN